MSGNKPVMTLNNGIKNRMVGPLMPFTGLRILVAPTACWKVVSCVLLLRMGNDKGKTLTNPEPFSTVSPLCKQYPHS